jgi:hypothetical protein
MKRILANCDPGRTSGTLAVPARLVENARTSPPWVLKTRSP